jgi:hypothetical protein
VRGFSRGVDIFLQKKLFDRYHDLVSYSYSKSRANTPFGGEFVWDFKGKEVDEVCQFSLLPVEG